MLSLTDIESRLIPLRWWRAWGVLIAPIRLWEWTCRGSWCWTMQGQREPLAYRWGVARCIWGARYASGVSSKEGRDQ